MNCQYIFKRIAKKKPAASPISIAVFHVQIMFCCMMCMCVITGAKSVLVHISPSTHRCSKMSLWEKCE